jgi:uncharacterized protein (DUF1330 family)
MSIYTLNLFDITPSRDKVYREYSRAAGKVISSLNGSVICSGWHPTTLRGEDTRSYFIVVEFPDREAFDLFLNSPLHASMHALRENSTENYIWKIFEPWDLKRWVAYPSLK